MANGMPELGSKISLISKADIRYEGRLFTVDPQECTIALANVRSFGTEDRETQYPIAPQSQIYDYILFRGSDIKDIRVVNNMPHPTDPAIMQMQLPNGQHLLPHFPPMQPMNTPMGNYPPQHPQQSGGVAGCFGSGGGGGLSNASGGSVTGGLPPPGLLQQQPHSSQQQQPPHQQQQQHQQQTNVGGPVGSSTSTSGGSGGLINVIGGSAPKISNNPIVGGTSGVIGGGGGLATNLISNNHNNHNNNVNNSNNDLLAGASRSTTPLSLLSRNKSPSTDMAVQVNQQQQNLGGNRDAGHKRPQNQQQPQNHRGQYNRDRRDSGRGNDYPQYDNRYNNNQRNSNQMSRGGWINRNNMNNNLRNNNRGRGGPRMLNQGYRPQYVNNKMRSTGKPLKFDDDFDFEKANTQFEELLSVFKHIKVSDDPKTENQQVNGEIEKKDDSGNETGAGEHENEEDVVGYDKSKSFFDNISCEAAQDRSKNKKNDWRQERKLNTETFGFPAKRVNYRGGRGNYYNRNVNSYRGYRPQNNGYMLNMNRNNSRNYNNTRPQSTGIPVKSVLNNPGTPNVAHADSEIHSSSQTPQQILKSAPESAVDSPKPVAVAAVK